METTKTNEKTKVCEHCGGIIPEEAVTCEFCGMAVAKVQQPQQEEQPQQAQQPQAPYIVINNNTTPNAEPSVNINVAARAGKEKNKWVSVILCFFLGYFGAHKFYEGKIGMGVLYLLTMGLCGIGVLVDFIMLLFKPNPYYVS